MKVSKQLDILLLGEIPDIYSAKEHEKYYEYKLHMTDGPYENIKITTPDDFYMMRAVLQAKEDAQLYTPY